MFFLQLVKNTTCLSFDNARGMEILNFILFFRKRSKLTIFVIEQLEAGLSKILPTGI